MEKEAPINATQPPGHTSAASALRSVGTNAAHHEDFESLGLPIASPCVSDDHRKHISHMDSCVTTVYND